MIERTYGELILDKQKNEWNIAKAEPHVCIKLKAIFNKIAKTESPPFKFINNNETCHDLLWFMERYPLKISNEDLKFLNKSRKSYINNINELESILLPDYKPTQSKLREGFAGRDYQLRGRDVYLKTKRILIGDEFGLGKTMIAILSFLEPKTLPALVVVQTHLNKQWKDEIEKYTELKVHIIKGTTPYSLPQADVYIMKYSCLAGWTSFYHTGFFKSVVFDEAQELRRRESNKYAGAEKIAAAVDYCLQLSGTPIYNYGDEIWNVLNVCKNMCLGKQDEFLREWGLGGYNSRTVADPAALGTHLRESFLFLRRTRKEVGRELPPINKIVYTVGYDEHETKKADEIARMLAIKVKTGTFVERGSAARELDIFVRQQTGISKAREVAAFIRIMLENNEPVLVGAWHRAVYDILLEELKDFNPMLYTGTESPKQKQETKDAFMNGETNLMIMSLRSGVGIDGLQKRCSTVILAELDWSPKVHDQFIARVNRDDAENIEREPVTAIYLVSDYGSDPVIIDMLGIKSTQSHNIVDPLLAVGNQHTDESRIQILAERFLNKK